MARFALILCACLAGGGARAAGEDDLGPWIEALSAKELETRSQAEREIARRARFEDTPQLAAALRAGSLEVRWRIASALGGDPRHFALAARLAADEDERVARGGADALAAQASEWLGAGEAQALAPADVERSLRGAFGGMWRLDLREFDLELALDRIARHVDARRLDISGSPPPTIVLDPALDPASLRPPANLADWGDSVVGSFEQLVSAASLRSGAAFDVYGWEGGRAILRVRSPAQPRVASAQALMLEWVLGVERARSIVSASASARALAALEWTVAIDWLEWRWTTQRDPAAFEGLVAAAARGSVVASLANDSGVRTLLQAADERLASATPPSPRARELARALQSIAPLGSQVWAEGFDRSSEAGRALRMALVARTGLADDGFAAAILARARAKDASIRERFAALRALAARGRAVGGEAPDDATLDALLSLSIAPFESSPPWPRVPLALKTLGWSEPASWQRGESLDDESLAALALDAIERSAEDARLVALAGQRLATLARRPNGDLRVDRLLEEAQVRAPRERLRAALAAARAAGAPAEILRGWALGCGLATAEESLAISRELLARDAWTSRDWRLAGSLIAEAGGVLDRWPREPTGREAEYDAFLDRLEALRDELAAAAKAGQTARSEIAGLDAPWVEACRRALLSLRSRQAEPGSRELLRRLRVLFQRSTHPLRRELSAGRFPPPPEALIVDLARCEPWLGF